MVWLLGQRTTAWFLSRMQIVFLAVATVAKRNVTPSTVCLPRPHHPLRPFLFSHPGNGRGGRLCRLFPDSDTLAFIVDSVENVLSFCLHIAFWHRCRFEGICWLAKPLRSGGIKQHCQPPVGAERQEIQSSPGYPLATRMELFA